MVKGSEAVLWKVFDVGVIDGLVNGLGPRRRRAWPSGCASSRPGLVRAYALAVLGGAVALLGYLLWS